MQEPHAVDTPSAGKSVATIVASGSGRPTWWLYRYRWTVYYGGGGLMLLWTVPGAKMKVLGAVFEIIAALEAIRVTRKERRKRNPAVTTAQEPESYANLQAAMARLHETEDKGHA